MTTEFQIASLKDWDIPYDKTFIIAGPCAAESEDQLMQTALGISGHPANLLRAGIWKPRTRPNSFCGVGIQGLSWLKQAGRVAGLPVCTEVAEPAHIVACLEHGVDVLWIGARTTANPFAVQALADALNGIDIPVMVKNPINPDLDLWIGALERINRVGITRMAAIHRGFSIYKPSLYRNDPKWFIPIELKRRIPDIPMFCDPSHLCGRVDLLRTAIMKAMDLQFDGLMIEAHVNPQTARSDAGQQVTPDEFGEIVRRVRPKRSSATDGEYVRNIQNLGNMVDEVDEQILDLIATRTNLAKEIGYHKKRHNVAILDIREWEQRLEQWKEAAVEKGLSPSFATTLFRRIDEECLRLQEIPDTENPELEE